MEFDFVQGNVSEIVAGFENMTLAADLIYGFGYAIIILVTVVSNGLIILAYITSASVRKRVCNIYIVSLACGDLMTGIIVMMIYYVARLVHISSLDSTWENTCRAWLTLKFIAINASFYSVLLISYDRYQLVTDTFNYKSYASRRVALIRVIAIWIWCIAYNIVYIVVSHNSPIWTDLSPVACGPVLASSSLVFQICIFLEPLLLFTALVGINGLMFVKMYYYGNKVPIRKNVSKRSQSRKSEIINSDFMSNAPGLDEKRKSTGRAVQYENSRLTFFAKPQIRKCKLWAVSLTRRSQHDSVDTLRRRKTAITLTLLVIVFVICWFPFFTYVILGYYHVIIVSRPVLEIFVNILLLNSTLNPFLYGLRNSRINNAVKLLLYRRNRKQRNRDTL